MSSEIIGGDLRTLLVDIREGGGFAEAWLIDRACLLSFALLLHDALSHLTLAHLPAGIRECLDLLQRLAGRHTPLVHSSHLVFIIFSLPPFDDHSKGKIYGQEGIRFNELKFKQNSHHLDYKPLSQALTNIPHIERQDLKG